MPFRRGPTPAQSRGPEVLRAEAVGTAGKLVEASFRLHGRRDPRRRRPAGHGQLDLFLACFGMTEIVRGASPSTGSRSNHQSRDAVRADIGISLVPEGPQDRGAVP